MNRLSLINAIISATEYKTYLEIGCYKGKTFFRVTAKTKIAVDPFFYWSFYRDFLFHLFQKPRLLVFKKTSDDFFTTKKAVLEKRKPIDIALIDGLHTFKAALSDVLNTLNYLQKNGTIILHDCNPPNAGAAMPTVNFPTKEEQMACSDWTGAWCGDVWKTIIYLKKNHENSLNVKVVNTDSGLGIVSLKSGIDTIPIVINNESFARIDKMTYSDLIKNKKDLLSLQEVSDFKNSLKKRFPNIRF